MVVMSLWRSWWLRDRYSRLLGRNAVLGRGLMLPSQGESGIKARGERCREDPRILLRPLLRSQDIEVLKAKGSGESLQLEMIFSFVVGVLYSGEGRVGTVPPSTMFSSSVWAWWVRPSKTQVTCIKCRSRCL